MWIYVGIGVAMILTMFVGLLIFNKVRKRDAKKNLENLFKDTEGNRVESVIIDRDNGFKMKLNDSYNNVEDEHFLTNSSEGFISHV